MLDGSEFYIIKTLFYEEFDNDIFDLFNMEEIFNLSYGLHNDFVISNLCYACN